MQNIKQKLKLSQKKPSKIFRNITKKYAYKSDIQFCINMYYLNIKGCSNSKQVENRFTHNKIQSNDFNLNLNKIETLS